ncbi:MAG TPA: xanthine dehydrogenase family protein molybdopterin-binding subunit [Actinomycetota bacterium]|nr:xanthine dehydrogenase family protein molybdopterin-binding subunit [Actinomycetota bacterium]
MSTSMYGRIVHRVEDPRFLTGRSRYVEDLVPERALRAVFVRSIMAHGRVNGLDAAEASGMPGVVAVFGVGDLDIASSPGEGGRADPFERPAFASEVVRFVGEPLALVVAETRAQAQDAGETVLPELEPLPVVLDPRAAAEPGAALLFPAAGSNVVDAFDEAWGEDVLAGSEVIARLTVRHQRVAPAPLETEGVLADPADDGSLTLWASTQVPFFVRDVVSERLGLSKELIRVVAPDVGGGFGAKQEAFPEYVAVAAAALRLGAPVAWLPTRSESMVSLTHGRAQVHDVELGATRDGRLVGLRVDIVSDMGAYPIASYLAETTKSMLSGVYRIPRIAARGRSVVTTTPPVGPYRGAGRPEATLSIERAIDVLAAEVDLDPVELRRRNLVPAEAFPFTTAVGTTYDVGDYQRALDEALALAGVERWRREQAERRTNDDRRALGIGVAVYVEVTGSARKEFASVEIDSEGSAIARVGTSSHGQGHETAFAQIVSGVLGIEIERVRVVQSDTAAVERGEGTFASRSLQIGGSSLFEAAGDVLEQARDIASRILEAAPEDVVPTDGGLGVAGSPTSVIAWSALAAAAADHGSGGSLSASKRRLQEERTFPFGAHVAIVEVDVETGEVRLVDHVAVDDCGRILNPLLVEGQVHGGLGQGIAQALFEEVVFDELGTPVTSTLSTYLFPAASELPSFRTLRIETPTPLNPLGAKGIGEAATSGSTPAIVNAAVDALGHLGVRHLDMPLSPERVLRAIRGAVAG